LEPLDKWVKITTAFFLHVSQPTTHEDGWASFQDLFAKQRVLGRDSALQMNFTGKYSVA
jgi:hypothetical protein